MPDETRQSLGDGQDNFAQAAQQISKAAGEISGKAVANSAAGLVKAGAQSGKAVSEIAAGTAAGGPWGAILAAAWSMRHTLYKILICACLILLIFVILIVSLPTVVTNRLFGLDGEQIDENATLLSAYTEMADAVTDAIDAGYDAAMASVEKIISDNGYDYDLSMDALVDYAKESAGFDTCYILAAYSASLEQKNTNKTDMIRKLNSVAGSIFPVTYEEAYEERLVPASYYTYRAVNITVVTGQTGSSYQTENRTYYVRYEERQTEVEITRSAYCEVTVTVPVWSGGRITGTRTETYYERDGTETVSPTTEIIKYAVCTIHPFDNTVITSAFDIDTDAQYGKFNVTYGQAIMNMANALKMTLYGTLGYGSMVPLTDAELIAFVNMQNCNATRKYILATALSLVGKVPYFWGGKSPPGWDDAWNTPRLVTAAGSPSSGTIRPYGLDCSGFATWVFETCFGINIGAGCNNQYTYTYAISADELLPGDLGFYWDGHDWGHILIFAGYDASGQRMWVHSTNGGGCNGVTLNHPSYEGVLSYRRCRLIDYNAPVPLNTTLTGAAASVSN